jgi:hypothetical protein
MTDEAKSFFQMLTGLLRLLLNQCATGQLKPGVLTDLCPLPHESGFCQRIIVNPVL